MKKYLWIVIPVLMIVGYMKVPAIKNFIDGIMSKTKNAKNEPKEEIKTIETKTE